jgi:hypothetical protein
MAGIEEFIGNRSVSDEYVLSYFKNRDPSDVK